MPRALVVDDDEAALVAVSVLVEKQGFSTHTASDWAPAKAELDAHRFDVVILDVMLPGGSGIDLLIDVPKERRPQVVLISGDDSMRRALSGASLQSLHFLQKPIDSEQLRGILREVRRACAPGESESREPIGIDRLVGDSPEMQRVRDLIGKVGATDFPVYIEGESGTGKEIVAQVVHEVSARRDAPFVAINCGAIPETLIDSELFGHDKGSFTGAKDTKPGVFEQATGGTLFLDEIAEMPIELQVRLLRILETGVVRRVGGKADIPIDVRVISATNRRFEDAIKDGRFREDLFYRLCVFPIAMPPLRQHLSDIPQLAEHFLRELAEREGVRKSLAPDALRALSTCSWPGNVRQLRNALQRAYIVAGATEITADCLPPLTRALVLVETEPTPSGAGTRINVDVGTSLADAERRLIEATLKEQSGNKRAAAEILGVSLRTLYNRLQGYAGGGDPDAAEPAEALGDDE